VHPTKFVMDSIIYIASYDSTCYSKKEEIGRNGGRKNEINIINCQIKNKKTCFAARDWNQIVSEFRISVTGQCVRDFCIIIWCFAPETKDHGCHGLFYWEGDYIMTRQIRADLMLLMITVFWGSSYILTKLALDVLQPFNLTALRFIIAFIAAAVVFYKNILKADIKTIKYSLILAVILFAVFILQTFGLKYTTASNAGFLVSLSVVFIPIISGVFLKQKIEKRVIIGVCIAPIGIALLTLNSQLSMNSGDVLCTLCSLLFAVHVVATGVFTKKVDSIALGVLQLGFVGLFSIVFSMFVENVRLPDNAMLWGAILALSILCTAVGYIVQAAAQKYTSATHAGLIFSLEPVFSAALGFTFLGEILSLRGYAGAAILLTSVLIAEVSLKKEDPKAEELDT